MGMYPATLLPKGNARLPFFLQDSQLNLSNHNETYRIHSMSENVSFSLR